MILTHLAFARNTIPAFYNILKCLQILSWFYVKRERIPNFRLVVSKAPIPKTLRLLCFGLKPEMRGDISCVLYQPKSRSSGARGKIEMSAGWHFMSLILPLQWCMPYIRALVVSVAWPNNRGPSSIPGGQNKYS